MIYEKKDLFDLNYQNNPVFVLGGFFLLYVLVTGFSLPGAAVLTLAAGFLFNFWLGLIVVSFASTIGASIAFLISRMILRDYFLGKYEKQYKKIDKGFFKQGNSYLLSLRLIPLFPFFVVNILMGLTSIRLKNFFFVSQIGMLPGTMVYIFAGKSLSEIQSISDIFSLNILIAFSLLGLLPFIIKKIENEISKTKKV